MTGAPVEAEFLKALRQREVQMIGAGISKRCWHEVETAYNQLRDKMDEALRAKAPTLMAARSGIEAHYGLNDVYPGDLVAATPATNPHETQSAQVIREALEEIATMMGRHVENWPNPKKLSTAVALIDKTLSEARERNQWREGIETAPSGKDDFVLVYCPDKPCPFVFNGKILHQMLRPGQPKHLSMEGYTHWRHLPGSPEALSSTTPPETVGEGE